MLFLTLDHVHNDGAAHRRALGKRGIGGAAMYRILKNQGFPPGFQILCFNCNWGKHHNGGVCPHKAAL